MIRGLYTAASGMIAGQRKQDALINNLSNLNTVGYKEDETALRSFPEVLMSRIRDGQGLTINGTQVQLPATIPSHIGALSQGAYAHELAPRFAAGPLQKTDNPLDVAIERDALNITDGRIASLFFTVQQPNGEIAYTRDGRWTVNDNGLLAAYNGALVLDVDGNPMQVGGNDIQITAHGTVLLTDPNDPTAVEELQIGVAMTENPAATLVKGENGYFRTVDGEALPFIELAGEWQYTITQGAIEGSNVNITRTMTQMIETMRYYEANQRVLQTTDRTLEKAATEIGRV